MFLIYQVMSMLCYITCYVMFYNISCYVTFYVMLYNILFLGYITCYVVLCLCYVIFVI